MKKAVRTLSCIMALTAIISSCSKDDININVGNEQEIGRASGRERGYVLG